MTSAVRLRRNFPNGAVAVLDKNLRYIYTAGEALQQLGLTETSLIGQPMEVVWVPEEAIRLKKEFQRVLRGERFFTNTTIGGNTYRISVSPLTSLEGVVDRVLAVSQNITNQQIALRQAQENETQFRTLAESIPGAVYVSTNDQDRKVLYISKGITSLCGYPVEDFVEGRIGATDLIHVDDRKVNGGSNSQSRSQPATLPVDLPTETSGWKLLLDRRTRNRCDESWQEVFSGSAL